MTGLEAGSGVVGVSAGYTHSLAVLADGSVLAWGSDSHGQLGDGGTLDQPTRVKVSGLGPGSGVVAVSAGYHHSLALRGDGSVLSWGDDSVGQLGDGGTPSAVRRTPVAVRGLGPGSGVVGVSAGVGHSAAVRLDGSVLTWGWDSYSQLGDGSTGASSTVPVAVRNLGPGSGVRAVAAGGYHTVVAKSASSTPATFAPVAPARVWDTRVGPGATGRVGPGGARNLAVTGVGGVPAAGVTAVVLNITAVNPSAATYVTVWPAGEARPLASNLNVSAGDTRPNLVTVKVGAFGLLSVFNAAGSVDLVADVAGWYGPTAGQRYTAVPPARVWDSRAEPGPTGRLGPGGVRDVPIAGQGGVPATGATAVVLNVTGASPTAATYVTAWPTGQARPLASNLNLPPGDIRANLVVVPVGPSGRVSFANAAGSVDLIVDVAGWFGTAGATFTSLSPTRVWDTRAGSGPSGRMGAGGTRSVVFAGAGGVPAAGVSAVAFNLVAVGPTAPTFVTAWPAGQPKPLASNLNVPPGDSRANLVVVTVGSGGQVSFSNATGTIDLVADVAGWYGLPQPAPPPPLPAPNPDAPPGSATTYQVNARHDGHAPGTLALASPGAPKWTHTFIPDNVPAAIAYAVTVGDRVFVAVSRSAVEPNGYNTYGVDLYALDAQTGATLWGPVQLGDATTSAALLTADSVAVYAVRDYGALQSFDQATGHQLWAAEVPAGWFTSPPTVAGGLLYVGAYTNEGVLFAVDTRTGLVRWTTDEVSGGQGPASVDGGSVYVSYSCNRDRRQDADRGTTIWEARPVCTGYGGRPAVLSSDSVYVGGDTGTWTRLSRSTGATLATIPGYQPPAIDGDVGLFLTSGSWDVPARLSARDQATGQVLWSATGDGRFTTPPLVVDGKVIEGSSTGRVTALDERTGAEVWSGTTGYSVGPGLNAGGGLLLVPAAGTLVAFGA